MIASYDPVEADRQYDDILKRVAAGIQGITMGTPIYHARQGGYQGRPMAQPQISQPTMKLSLQQC